jgi:hypothetical protein
MYNFAVTVLLGLALFKIVDILEDLVPGLTKLHDAVTVALAVAGAFAIDYSLFDGFRVDLRYDWMGEALTGVVIAGTTSVWRALFHWLGTSEGDEPEVRHQGGRVIGRAA